MPSWWTTEIEWSGSLYLRSIKHRIFILSQKRKTVAVYNEHWTDIIQNTKCKYDAIMMQPLPNITLVSLNCWQNQIPKSVHSPNWLFRNSKATPFQNSIVGRFDVFQLSALFRSASFTIHNCQCNLWTVFTFFFPLTHKVEKQSASHKKHSNEKDLLLILGLEREEKNVQPN